MSLTERRLCTGGKIRPKISRFRASDLRNNELTTQHALVIVALAVLLVVCGAGYQLAEARIDSRRFPQQGKLVDIGGYRLDISCTGQGSPTVDDRAGYGWSDGSPFPQTSAQIAKELRQLLQNAGEKPPYVLVGHSFGGLAVRVFNGEYPNEVAGMFLSDSGAAICRCFSKDFIQLLFLPVGRSCVWFLAFALKVRSSKETL